MSSGFPGPIVWADGARARRAGRLWKIGFQFRGMNAHGDMLTAWGRITAKEAPGASGMVTLGPRVPS